MITLVCTDIAMVIHDDEPPKSIDTSYEKVVERYKNWEKANWLALMIIKDCIPNDLHGTISSTDQLKDYLKVFEEQFKASPNVVVNSILS